MTCPSPAARQWTMAMLTASTDRDPIRFEVAAEVTPEGAAHLAQLAVGFLRICAKDHNRCPHGVLAEMGLHTAEDIEGLL